MDKESIHGNLDSIKETWLKGGSKKAKLKKQKETESKKEVREFVRKNRKYLKTLKSQYPEEFEKYYWDICVYLKRTNIVDDVNSAKLLPFVSLMVSVMGVTISASDIISDFKNLGLITNDFLIKALMVKVLISLVTLIGNIAAIVVLVSYIRSVMDTREVSYYEIMLSILEDLRNGETKTFDEIEDKDDADGDAEFVEDMQGEHKGDE